MRMKRLALLIPAFLSAGVACRADITIGDPPGFAVNIATFAPTGQSFTADGAALKSIGMWTTTCNCPNDPPVQFQLKLLSGAGTSGALVATRTATAPIGLFGFLDFDFTGVSLVVGQTYTAMMSQISGPPTSPYTLIYGVTNVYPGGMAFWQGQPRPDLDFSLRVVDLPATAPALQYAAKFLCGQSSQKERAIAAAGTYFTVINLHNPAEKEIAARMKVATIKSNGQPGSISHFFPITLNADQAMAVECPEIQKMGNIATPFSEGFVIVESDLSMDVVSVYTAGQGGKVATLEIERVPERKLR